MPARFTSPAGSPHPPVPAPAPHSTVTNAQVIGWSGLALVALVGAAVDGLSGAFNLVGLYIGAVAVVGLIRGQVRWARLTSRTVSVATGAVAVAAIAIGGLTSPSTDSPRLNVAATSPAETVTEATGPEPTTAEDPIESAISLAAPGTALATLQLLKVTEETSTARYARSLFGASATDIDGNGCDQRNDILRRDLTNKTLRPGGCIVVTGTLRDPYTSKKLTLTKSSATQSPIQLDRVVSLPDAWAKGAQKWSTTKRVRLASDPLNLLAVAATSSTAKDGQDAAAWLPPSQIYRCRYVARQVAVKREYSLAVSPAERTVIATTLMGCTERKLPAAQTISLGGSPVVAVTTAPAVKPTTIPAPTPAPATPTPVAASPVQGVHPGAYCAPVGAFGYTNRGRLMQCSSENGAQARWRPA
jgi:hypothetical protein